jgi:transcriptional regulator NrdR family protein
MLTVIKRNGENQVFDIEKIKNSLAAASDESRAPLNKSDINNIAHCLERIVADKTVIHSKEIYTVLAGILYVQGFREFLKEYGDFADNKEILAKESTKK